MLYLRGRSLLHQPLSERRALLHEWLPDHEYLAPCQGVVGKGRKLFQSALKAGHEGIVAKRLTSPYVPNSRTDAWRKIKKRMELPCVVIGYRTDRQGLQALLLASMKAGKPAYVGTVELGIRQAAETLELLKGHRINKAPVPCSLSAEWVRPDLFCYVTFAGWRPGGWWRDAAFAGWADDESHASLRAR
jgi:bifunctional non-homologous end joining protein LigD